MFNDYYGMHEPQHTKFDAIRELKMRLNRKKVININVIDDEEVKIKKENEGKGAMLSTNFKVDDTSLKSFYRELSRTLLNPHKDDKFMEMKIGQAREDFKREIRMEKAKELS